MADKIIDCICSMVDAIGFDVFFAMFLLSLISFGIIITYKGLK